MSTINPKKLVRAGALFVVGLALSACAAAPTPAAPAMAGMAGMDTASVPKVPAGLAYVDGKEIYFMHTEVSDAGIAKLLSAMMNSPVIEVPSLAKAPAEMLSDVYVFKNGIKGMGPLGFQPDVFDNPPGSKGYTPLRRLVLVTWKDEKSSRELKSLADVKAAESKAEITFERPGVVINMPFVTWPDGKR
jgi:hypothetical protein